MADKPKKPISGVTSIILGILQAHPEGLDIVQIREIGGITGQQHLDKRVRELYPFYEITRTKEGRRHVYRLIKERTHGEYDYSLISKTLRAKILHRDGRRCRMCGKTVDLDGIKLHVDHKIPRDWGGLTIEENLWSLCSACNEGKRDYFSSFDGALMQSILTQDSVHRRIAELLKTRTRQWIDCDLLEFVANFEDYQTDWRKRLRELRYVGLEIETKNVKQGRRTISFYRLNNWVDLPPNLSEEIRRFEVARGKKGEL